VGRRRWNDYDLLEQVEEMMKSAIMVEQMRQDFRKEARKEIPMLWQRFVEKENSRIRRIQLLPLQAQESPTTLALGRQCGTHTTHNPTRQASD
jgi:hypothetical protein